MEDAQTERHFREQSGPEHRTEGMGTDSEGTEKGQRTAEQGEGSTENQRDELSLCRGDEEGATETPRSRRAGAQDLELFLSRGHKQIGDCDDTTRPRSHEGEYGHSFNKCFHLKGRNHSLLASQGQEEVRGHGQGDDGSLCGVERRHKLLTYLCG